jgi:hypothetical protein
MSLYLLASDAVCIFGSRLPTSHSCNLIMLDLLFTTALLCTKEHGRVRDLLGSENLFHPWSTLHGIHFACWPGRVAITLCYMSVRIWVLADTYSHLCFEHLQLCSGQLLWKAVVDANPNAPYRCTNQSSNENGLDPS